jgi:DNA-binding CsgD family transcriptional regulator
MDTELVDRIYEAPFAPELWPAILDDLARIADARGGELFLADSKVVNWTASDVMRGSMERFIAGNWLQRGERLTRLINARHTGFLTEPDIYSEEERQADPVYRDLLIPVGLGWAAAMGITLPTGNVVCLCLEREGHRGPVERERVAQLDALRPHLARSALLSARLQLERARTATESLARIGLPALVMDNHGKVLAANAAMEALTAHVRWRPFDTISLKDMVADALLKQAIEGLERADDRPVRSFALRSNDEEATLVAHVVPFRGSARDIFIRSAAILVLTPVTLPNAPPAELIRSLFDLSPAEARVARHLAAGATVAEIAVTDRVSSNTVRTQVRGVLGKTGCRRQAEIVALLGGVQLRAN